jgi:para-nitrobenzyl esterase
MRATWQGILVVAASALSVSFLAGSRALAAGDAPVRIESGLLGGVAGEDPGVRVFRGVPYAAPPVGPLRWHAPQAVARWEGVRKADQFAAVCLQPARTGISALLPTAPRLTPPSEDCLYLNVWTAAKSADAGLPVMVYFPGGGFTTGGGSGLVFDGEALAKKGVVLVTTNYRLGVFGFFAHPELTRESGHEASGNYGLMDQAEALRWVQKNITAFGGDPRRVTIFGQSAGSTSVLFQMASPLSKGLFHRAIGESGGIRPTPMMPRRTAEQAGVTLATSLGARSIADLRAKSAVDLMAASPAGTGPIIDGWVLREEVADTLRKKQHNDVPLLIGSNSAESNVLLRSPLPAAKYIERSKAEYGPLFDAYVSLYPAGSEEEAKTPQATAFNDRFAWGMWKWASLHAASPASKAYLYYFTRRPPADAPIPGAAHDGELYYVFHNLRLFKQQWADWDRRLEDTLSSYWVNFAVQSDPNGEGLPRWPAYRDEQRDRLMVFGDRVEVGASRLDSAKLAFWEKYHAAAMSKR